jgi:hypothetical protein
MDVSYISIILFIITTVVYFTVPSIGKIPLTLSDLANPDKSLENYSTNLTRLGLYFLTVVVVQFLLNVSYLIGKCGGSIGKNVGASALFTFIPWVFIFGIMIATLIIYPGFKSAFSDVIGYFAVAGSANAILSAILVDPDVSKIVDTSTTLTSKEKSDMRQSAEAIMKICGNKSILINQMTPDNFLNIWDTMKPLMREQGNIPDIDLSKQKLFDLVVLKDNIGEGMWYVYSAILISSIVYYNLATRGCIKDINQIKSDHDAYIEEQEQVDKKAELNNSTVYNMGT